MRIGFSRVDITPPVGVYLCGQLEPMRSDGIESRLYARAMSLRDGHSCAVLCGCDILAVTNEMSDAICKEASALTGIPEGNIVVSATHTHSGPNTVDVFGKNADANYVAGFRAGVVRAIVEAVKEGRDGVLSVADGELDGYAFNRRFIMSDGTIETHPLKGDPHIVTAEGPDSKKLSVLYACDKKGHPFGAAVVFGCHGTVLERDNTKISSDYPGKVCEYLSEKLELDSNVLFFVGACGNICQVNPLDTSRKEVGLEWAKKMGEAIAGRCLELLGSSAKPAKGRLRVIFRTIELPRREIPSELVEWTEKHQSIEGETPRLSDYGSEEYGQLPEEVFSLEEIFKTPFWANFYANEITTLNRLRKQQPNMPLTIKVIAQDNWAMVALPCELFVEWSNAICQDSPFEFTSIVTLANGWNGYVPTQRAFERKGGYETKEVTSTMLVPRAGEMVFDAVMDILEIAKNR